MNLIKIKEILDNFREFKNTSTNILFKIDEINPIYTGKQLILPYKQSTCYNFYVDEELEEVIITYGQYVFDDLELSIIHIPFNYFYITDEELKKEVESKIKNNLKNNLNIKIKEDINNFKEFKKIALDLLFKIDSINPKYTGECLKLPPTHSKDYHFDITFDYYSISPYDEIGKVYISYYKHYKYVYDKVKRTIIHIPINYFYMTDEELKKEVEKKKKDRLK